jgi:secreted trypsin-like serine protease
MNYPAPRYGVARPPAKSPSTKTIVIIVIIVVILFIIVVAIGLGVGLGIGLKKHNSDTSTSASTISAPLVTCTYGGPSTCGCSEVKPSFISTRIVNGYTAVANSWPWIVALYIDNYSRFCGGFLISYQYVVTAAHCVDGITASTIIVYAGIQQLSSLSSGQSRVVSAVTVHSDYDSTDLTNDIAVLTLVSAFNETSTVGQCCLTFDTSLPSVGQTGVIAGWGTTSESTSTPSNDLQQGVIEVQTLSSCTSASTSDVQFCAGFGDTNACFGDSGSPFMISNNNLWTCAGLVSGTTTCGSNTLYARVTAFQSFIDGVING